MPAEARRQTGLRPDAQRPWPVGQTPVVRGFPRGQGRILRRLPDLSRSHGRPVRPRASLAAE